MSTPREELAGILMQKTKVYDEFESATALLRKALDADRIGAVVDFIKRREELMRDIASLDRRIDRHQRRSPSAHHPADGRLAERLSQELDAKLKRIMAVDADCRAIAASNCDEARKELMRVSQTREGIHGYGRNAKRLPKFLNIET